MTLSMRAFGSRNSAYAFLDMTDIPTDRPTDTYISREISIEHPSVGLASLAQLLPIVFIDLVSCHFWSIQSLVMSLIYP